SFTAAGLAVNTTFAGATFSTATVVLPEPEAPSLSVTVTVMSYGASPGRLSRYRWPTPLKLSTPAPRVRVVSGEPSPQRITTVCVSSVPGSVNDPLRVVEPFSLIAPGPDSDVTVGATFLTVTSMPAVADAVLPLEPSVAVAVTVSVNGASPGRLSGRVMASP